MRGLDDGPDGLREDVFDRAMGVAKPKRVRKPKVSPFARLASEMGSALRRFQKAVGTDIDDTSVVCDWHRQYHEGGGIWPWAAVGALHEAEDMAHLFVGIREACR